MFTFLQASASLIGQMNDFIVGLRLAAFLPSRLLFLPSLFDRGEEEERVEMDRGGVRRPISID